jgi:hypothetical protein
VCKVRINSSIWPPKALSIKNSHNSKTSLGSQRYSCFHLGSHHVPKQFWTAVTELVSSGRGRFHSPYKIFHGNKLKNLKKNGHIK